MGEVFEQEKQKKRKKTKARLQISARKKGTDTKERITNVSTSKKRMTEVRLNRRMKENRGQEGLKINKCKMKKKGKNHDN